MENIRLREERLMRENEALNLKNERLLA